MVLKGAGEEEKGDRLPALPGGEKANGGLHVLLSCNG